VSKQEAASLLGLDLSMTPLLPPTELARGERRTGTYTATRDTDHYFRMTGLGDADLWVSFMQPITKDTAFCKENSRTAFAECETDLQAGTTVYWQIEGASDTSTVQLGVGIPGGPAEYIYDTEASRFYYVEMDVTFIGEPDMPARTSHYPEALTKYAEVFKLAYVLEADANGWIIGGEWVGRSHVEHPDFAWWPTGPPGDALGISYADLKSLVTTP
jgi:hypothetical protein